MVCPTMGGADGLGGESQPIDSLSTKKREGGDRISQISISEYISNILCPDS